MRSIVRLGRVVLRDRLHRPFDGMATHVLHRRKETNLRRVVVKTNAASELNAGLGIGGTGKFDPAALVIRKDSKAEYSIVQKVGIAPPMMLVFITFRQQP